MYTIECHPQEEVKWQQWAGVKSQRRDNNCQIFMLKHINLFSSTITEPTHCCFLRNVDVSATFLFNWVPCLLWFILCTDTNQSLFFGTSFSTVYYLILFRKTQFSLWTELGDGKLSAQNLVFKTISVWFSEMNQTEEMEMSQKYFLPTSIWRKDWNLCQL